MPTPYGSRGGIAFGVAELRVLRRALALALHPTPASAEDVQECLRLAESLDEAMREGARLRAFLVADLARYRDALPGTAAGYLALLEEALGAGYRPEPDDLAALRALRGSPAAAALLDRCQVLAEQDVRARLARGSTRRATRPTPTVPASRTRLLALPGGRSARPDGATGRGETVPTAESATPGRAGGLADGAAPGAAMGVAGALARDAESFARSPAPGLVGEPAKESAEEPAEEPARKPGPKPSERPERPERPAAPKPASPAPAKPTRPIPTPGEVFPRRKPATPPPARPPQQLAAG